jgi:hypothetical protein
MALPAVSRAFGRSRIACTGAAANSRLAPSQAVIANILLDAVHPISDLVDGDKMATKYGGLEFRF